VQAAFALSTTMPDLMSAFSGLDPWSAGPAELQAALIVASAGSRSPARAGTVVRRALVSERWAKSAVAGHAAAPLRVFARWAEPLAASCNGRHTLWVGTVQGVPPARALREFRPISSRCCRSNVLAVLGRVVHDRAVHSTSLFRPSGVSARPLRLQRDRVSSWWRAAWPARRASCIVGRRAADESRPGSDHLWK